MSAILLPFALCCFTLGFALPPTQRVWGFAFGAFLGFALVGMMVFLIHHARQNSGRRVLVLPEGVLFVPPSSGNGTGDVFAWEEIESVHQAVVRSYVNGINVGTSHNYTVRRNDGQEVRFDDIFSDAETLGQTIQRSTFPFLMRRAQSAFDAGQMVSFGKLHVSKQGLGNGRETLPWSAVEAVNVADGVIQVRKQGQWLRWSHCLVSEMPNVAVFLASCNNETVGSRLLANEL